MLQNNVKFESNELIALFGEENCLFVENFETISVSTDSRTLNPNSIFVALKGENYDGHSNIIEALEKGAKLCIVNKEWHSKNESEVESKNLIIVENTLQALGKLANFHRMRFDLDIIAVAGSNGKTTTKEMIADILSSQFKVLRTYKNFNNQIGVPLMLFQIDETFEKAVLEIGTNEPGEIVLLSEMVSPTSGIITNIGKEHLEGFIDLDGVEIEETSLFAFLKKSDVTAFVNMNDERLRNYVLILDNKYTYGLSDENLYTLNAIAEFDKEFNTKLTLFDSEFSFEINLKAKGLNFVYNSIAAIAVGLHNKISIENIIRTMESYMPDSGSEYARMAIETKNGITLLNDTYNANPSSTKLALETLQRIPGVSKKIAVLGDMRELGEHSIEEHIEILNDAVQVADKVFLFGEFYHIASEMTNAEHFCHFESKEILFEFLKEEITEGTAVLVKGSRGLRMEEISIKIRSEFLS